MLCSQIPFESDYITFAGIRTEFEIESLWFSLNMG